MDRFTRIFCLMIAHLNGTLASRGVDNVVIDVQGVGYLVGMTARDLTKLPGLDAEVRVHVLTHFRDGAISLFGFLEAQHRDVFIRLIDINGVGPKLALAILSTLTLQQLWDTAMSGNYATLSHVRGVGPQKARKLMVELKDALRDFRPSSMAAPAASAAVAEAEPAAAAPAAADTKKKPRASKKVAPAAPPPGAGLLWRDVRSALTNMGFPELTVEEAITTLQRDEPGASPADLDRLVREGLKRLRGVKR